LSDEERKIVRRYSEQSIIEVARPLGIAVHDHIIAGKEGHASFKGLKLI
jgi:DNA repair protein RadC